MTTSIAKEQLRLQKYNHNSCMKVNKSKLNQPKLGCVWIATSCYDWIVYTLSTHRI